ncbi:MAG: hypothetical protein M3Y87_27535, partial [Myxococcota bacterium]|nr:hypothetical protein [Myxococcota bacterium]
MTSARRSRAQSAPSVGGSGAAGRVLRNIAVRTRAVGARAVAVAAVIAITIVATLQPATTHAQGVPGCPAILAAWVSSCDAGDEPVRLEACPAGHAILRVGPGQLRVDVSRSPERAFVAAGPLGLSPIGQFASWQSVERRDRDAFDALVRCARERPEPVVDALAAHPGP